MKNLRIIIVITAWVVGQLNAFSLCVEDSLVSLPELNVRAIKQDEKLRVAPVASSFLSSSELETVGAVSVKSISDMVPNFYVPDYGSRITSTMYVRGIGARIDQPAVGLNVDNVPVLNKNAYDFDLADIEYVEMLRGPQTNLFGRNTIGGLINITTLSPMRVQGWRFSLSGATHSDWKASAGWYHKFDIHSAMSAVANFSSVAGVFRNDFTGRLLDHERSGAIRLKYNYVKSSSFSLQNVLSSSMLNQGGYPYESVETGKISYNDPSLYHRFTIMDGLTMRAKIANVSLTSISSMQYINDRVTLDQDFLPLPYFTLTQRQHDISFTEDVIISGKALDGRYKYTAGGFLFYKHLSMAAPVTFKDEGIARLIEDHRNSANPDYPIEWDTREFPLNSHFRIPTFGTAIYHQSEFTLGGWKFNLGIRLDWEKSRLSYLSDCDTGYEIFKLLPDGARQHYRDVNINIHDSGHLKRSYLNCMPSLGVVFTYGESSQSNLYLNIAKGYKAGGFNTQMFSDVLQQRLMGIMGIGSKYDVDDVVGYKPEYSWNYEVGTHFTIPSIRLDLDMDIFYIDCHHQQLTSFPDGTTTGRIMTNAGHTRSMGAEASLSWQPNDKIVANVSYGFTDARFIKFFDGKENYKGKRIPYAPANTFFGMVLYRFPISSLGPVRYITPSANVRATGNIYWNESNSLSQPFYALIDADVEVGGKGWSVSIWGKNLTNTHYYTFYFLSMGNEFLQRGRPAQIGATLRFEI